MVLGPGGVGKTTSSVAIAFNEASKGQRVALISIDPARRLASALGMKVDWHLASLDISLPNDGVVDAAMVDQKKVFDSIVERFSSSDKIKDRIFENKIYQSVSENLAGAVEFMAVAQLGHIVEQNKYDVIVLDTPPEEHALDFLNRPNILSDFVDNKALNYFIKPFYLAKKLRVGKLVNFGISGLKGLSEILGFSTLEKLAEFLYLQKDVIEGLRKSSEVLSKEFHSDSTKFVLVTRPQISPIEAAKRILTEMELYDFKCDYIVLNRCFDFNKSDLPKIENENKFVKYMSGRISLESHYLADLQEYLSIKDADFADSTKIIHISEKDSTLDNYQGVMDFSKDFYDLN